MMNPNLFNICYSRVREGATPCAGDDKHFNTKIVEVPPSPLSVEKEEEKRKNPAPTPCAAVFFLCVGLTSVFTHAHISLSPLPHA